MNTIPKRIPFLLFAIWALFIFPSLSLSQTSHYNATGQMSEQTKDILPESDDTPEGASAQEAQANSDPLPTLKEDLSISSTSIGDRAKYEETLLFGIVSQRLEVIKRIVMNKELDLYPLIVQQFDLEQNPDVLILMIMAVQTLEIKQAIPKIGALLSHPEPKIVSQSISALGSLKDATSMESILALLGSKSERIQESVIDYIAALEYTNGAQLLVDHFVKNPSLAEVLKSKIILTLGKIKAVDKVDFILQTVKNQGLPISLRTSALSALGELKYNEAFDFIKGYMYSENVLLKREAIRTLGKLDHQEIESILLSACKEEDEVTRVIAVQALSDHPGSLGIKALQFMFKSDPSYKVKKAVFLALCTNYSPEIDSFLNDRLTSSDTSASDMITTQINSLPQDKATQFLETIFKASKNDYQKVLVLSSALQLKSYTSLALLKEIFMNPTFQSLQMEQQIKMKGLQWLNKIFAQHQIYPNLQQEALEIFTHLLHEPKCPLLESLIAIASNIPNKKGMELLLPLVAQANNTYVNVLMAKVFVQNDFQVGIQEINKQYSGIQDKRIKDLWTQQLQSINWKFE